jgi:hypothetical protein
VKLMAAVLVTTLFGLQGAESGTEKETAPPYRAESSAYVIKGKNAWTFVTENRSFRFAEVLGDDGNYEALLLLEESFRNEQTDGVEGVKGVATVKAWTLEPNRPRKLRWAIQETGNQGDIQDRFFRVTAWGCCDIPVVYSFYNLLSGKKVYVSNGDLLQIRAEDYPRGVRLVAFGYGGLSELNKPPVLQYGTDKKASQRFSVISSRESYDAPKVFVSTGEDFERSLDLRGSPINFTIVLKYEDGVVLRIPVEGNVIRPEKAALPTGYSLRAEE